MNKEREMTPENEEAVLEPTTAEASEVSARVSEISPYFVFRLSFNNTKQPLNQNREEEEDDL